MTQPSPTDPFYTLNRSQASLVMRLMDKAINQIRNDAEATDDDKQTDRECVELMNRIAWFSKENDKAAFDVSRPAFLSPIEIESLPEKVHPEYWRQGADEWHEWVLDSEGDWMGVFQACDANHARAAVYLAQVYLARLDPANEYTLLGIREAIVHHLQEVVRDYNALIQHPLIVQMKPADLSGSLSRLLRSLRGDIATLSRLCEAYLQTKPATEEIKGVSAPNSPATEPTAESWT